MRTLAILAALLLVALQAQGGPLQERAEEAPAEEQPGAQDQDVAISFAEDESSGLRAAGSARALTCYCRRGGCRNAERLYGTCTSGGRRYSFCCR
ncbi:defensin alpha 5-like [Nycticebus coucang]|uniref:defensin alpha 5-like n=1 Tax=Nycticebus coucang TaxID=9470 RepID=UPI00234C4643|nr:defensin alpha 5-like [Nycticebus coucang]